MTTTSITYKITATGATYTDPAVAPEFNSTDEGLELLGWWVVDRAAGSLSSSRRTRFVPAGMVIRTTEK